MREIIGIMACNQDYVISSKGELPWKCPEEVAFYRKMIRHQIVIMGYTTFMQMPQSFLEEHTVVVFSRMHRSDTNPLVTFVSSIDEFDGLKNLPLDRECFMIGGAEVATLFLKNKSIDRFYLSIVEGHHSGDIYFPIALIDQYPKTIYLSNPAFTVFLYSNLKAQDD